MSPPKERHPPGAPTPSLRRRLSAWLRASRHRARALAADRLGTIAWLARIALRNEERAA